MIQMQIVPEGEMGLYWPLARPRLAKVLDENRLLPDDLLTMIVGKKVLFIIILREGEWIGELTLEQVTYPRGTYVRVFTLSGTSLLEHLPEIAGSTLIFAEQLGFAGLEAIVRPGLAQKLADCLPNVQVKTWVTCNVRGRRQRPADSDHNGTLVGPRTLPSTPL